MKKEYLMIVALALLINNVYAQLGTGWVQTTHTYAVHLDNESGLQTFAWSNYRSVGTGTPCADYRYDASTESHTFNLYDNRTNRSEIRIYNDYSTGRRQFEGYVTIYAPLNDESLFQIFGSTSGATQLMIRGFASNNGRINGGGSDLATNVYGVEKRINVIHDQDNTIKIYVNGILENEIVDDEAVSNYWKFGCYGTLTTNGATVKWRKVSTFRDGNAPSVNQSPIVSIASPSNNTTFTAPANITINANASDASPGTISKVDFYRGTTLVGTDNTSPYSYTWTGATAGTYSLTARATDNEGAVTTSAVVSVVVNSSQNQIPVVSITAPSNNISYTAPANFTITANASDADGTISKVDFYRGTTLLGTDNTNPYSVAVSGLVAGTYSLTAIAIDNAGATKTSAAINVTVQATTTGCTAPQYVENGGYVEGSNVQNAGSKYQCKSWPYSGWCNGAAWAYAPGTGSYWQDAWTLVGTCTAKTATTTTVSETALLTTAPNPFGNTTTIKVIVETAGETSVIVYDQMGREVAVLANGYLSENTYSFNLDGNKLNAGLYVCRFVNNDKIISTTISKH